MGGPAGDAHRAEGFSCMVRVVHGSQSSLGIRTIRGCAFSVVQYLCCATSCATRHRIEGCAGMSAKKRNDERSSHGNGNPSSDIRQTESERMADLRASQRDFLTQYANDVVILADDEAHILEVNDRASSVYGYTREELLDMSLADLHPLGARDCAREELKLVKRDGSRVFESTHARKDGVQCHMEVSSRAIHSGGRTIYLALERDVTERKVAEMALRESEGRYRMLAESSPLAIFVSQNDKVIVVNAACVILFGASAPEDLSGKSTLELFHPDSQELISQRISAGGIPAPLVEARIVRIDGTLLNVSAAAFLLEEQGLRAVQIVMRDITERKDAEVAQLESEEQLRLAVQDAPLPLMIHAEDGEVIHVNRAWTELSGYSILDIPTIEGWTTKAYGEGAESVREDIERLYSLSGREDEGEYSVRTADGSTRVWDFSNSPIGKLPDGRRIVMSAARDITERKQAEKAVVERSERLQSLLDNAPYGAHMYELMPNDRLVLVGYNARAVEMLKVDHEALLGHTLEEAFPGNVGTETPKAYRRVARDGGTFSIEMNSYDEGSIKGVFEVYAFSTGPNQVSVFFRDITELKRVEETLRQSESRYRALAESSPLGIFVTKRDQVILVNPACAELFGASSDDLIGKSALGLFHPDSQDSVRERICEDAENVPLIEVRIVRLDGTPVDVEASASVLVDQGVNAIQVVLRDITERKKTVDQLLARTEDLASSNAELEKFAYVASHDLQEPLRMVASFVQLLQRRYAGKLDSDADEFIGYAVDGATRMQTLINDLLAYSRVGTKGDPFLPSDLEIVFRDVLRSLERLIDESGATVTHDHLPTVVCDPTQIGQVFQNVVTNAIKFSDGEAPKIHVSAREAEGQWVFSVKDNGIGLESQYFERIFVIFQRLQARVDYAGTGMGLAICKRIVERHGGHIWVESALDVGSTFYFTLRDGKEE